MAPIKSDAADKLFEAILKLENIEECYRFFEDLCTVKELDDISQRLWVAQMLFDEKNYVEISSATGASTATISRINRCLLYGSGGYREMLEKIKKGEKQ